MTAGTIRAGIGGWIFEPWRGTFYPEGLSKAKELNYAGQHLQTIEINSTYYGTQKPETFAKWAGQVPDGFIFSVKGNRFVTNRKVLAEAGESMERFIKSGLAELGDRLGPLIWQFAPTKKFDIEDFGAFLDLLPRKEAGLPLRHAVEVRNPSFIDPDFIALARKKNVAIVYAEHFEYPEIADVTSDFVYARLQKGDDNIETAYSTDALDKWAERAQLWAKGGVPDDLPLAAPNEKTQKHPRDVFVYFIHEGKVRAPQAAQALTRRIQ
ncbi:uncharacterized protein YecE (DUF72 family) [Phyllobacterium ifriqiyense]|uniref:Uncharacterized protein YecE (DUF72 family) n=1 Tax=Phyllobacterium ifriqiyense TaxID=314238 RepID=A0ABU0SE33_9HYPH|nr:DUF72 domain-containing protein [Phyllobacterium ifriqiyense]MDQ0999029.1 uncharacterized protein YecE (DUF72 family) [Phyllobacterium ifriqiyense]